MEIGVVEVIAVEVIAVEVAVEIGAVGVAVGEAGLAVPEVAVGISAVEAAVGEVAAEQVAVEAAMRGCSAGTARAGSGCANTGVCAITASAYVRGGISVAVDCCSVGDVCGCSAVLGPAEVPGASGACCCSSVWSSSSSTAPANLRAFKEARLRRCANASGQRPRVSQGWAGQAKLQKYIVGFSSSHLFCAILPSICRLPSDGDAP